MSDRYLRMYAPLLEEVKTQGGSGVPRDIIPRVIQKMNFSEDELNEFLPSGANRLENEVRWAADYLKKFGFLDQSVRGVWVLTELGRETEMDIEFGRIIRSKWLSENKRNTKKKSNSKIIIQEEMDLEMISSDRTPLQALRELSPTGFEKFCKRLLDELGFVGVENSGKPGDGGIDGIGFLQVSPLISLKIFFQCKRYQKTVGAGEIRDFRGAMHGRTDMGILFTTGTFSAEAINEATRDGAPQIELVNGTRLVNLMVEYGIGVSKRSVFVVDEDFFENFND